MEKAANDPITKMEFLYRIRHAHSGTSPGPSGVTADMLKLLPPEWLNALFNCILILWEQKYVPDIWKDRVKALIPKPTTARLVNEYRPIFLSILRTRFTTTLTKYNILHSGQTGGLPTSVRKMP